VVCGQASIDFMTKTATRRRSDPAGESTQSDFLDAAEQLFAESGFDGAKVRAIADAAGANLGALHYYWGSKEELFRAVWERRLRPLNEMKLRRLQACREEAERDKIDLHAILRAVIYPGLIIGHDEEKPSEEFRRLYGRALSDPSPVVKKIVADFFDATGPLFLSLIRCACPHLSDKELFWRLHGVFGAVLDVHVGGGRISRLLDIGETEADVREGVELLVHFLAAGLAAPSMQS
jgi:AcrR family transcriptional regulator